MSGELPSGIDHDCLRNFITLQAIRTPFARRIAQNAIDKLAKADLRKRVDEIADSEELRQFVMSDDYQVSVDQTWLLGQTMEIFGKFLNALGKREWSLAKVADGDPDLICSDTPFCQAPISGTGISNFTIESRESMIFMPLNRRILITGPYDMRASVGFIKPEAIPKFNTFIIQAADCVYSAEPDFVYFGRDGVVCYRSDLIASLRSQGAK